MSSSLIAFVLLAFVLNFVTIQVSADLMAVTHTVTLGIAKNNRPIGNIKLGLFGRRFPEIADNFYALSSDQGLNGMSYRGTILQVDNFHNMIKGGDITSHGGLESIFNRPIKFPPQEQQMDLHIAGLLAASNNGDNKMGPAFVLTTEKMIDYPKDELIVFGYVTDQRDIQFLRSIAANMREQLSTPRMIPEDDLIVYEQADKKHKKQKKQKKQKLLHGSSSRGPSNSNDVYKIVTTSALALSRPKFVEI